MTVVLEAQGPQNPNQRNRHLNRHESDELLEYLNARYFGHCEVAWLFEMHAQKPAIGRLLGRLTLFAHSNPIVRSTKQTS